MKRATKKIWKLEEKFSIFWQLFTCELQKAQYMVIRGWGLVILVMIRVGYGHVAAMEMGPLSGLMGSSVTAMFVFGDSSVDCGDNNPFYDLLLRNLSLFPCNGSDATLLPQLLAKKIGLPNTTPFYKQNGSMDGILGGVNFGSAEATILYPDSRGYQSLNQQLRQASETIQLLQLQLGQEKANNFIKSSIFYLSFGKDDFIHYFLDKSSSRISRKEFSHILVQQMTNAIRNLYANDVRKIVCAGVLPLGCAPRMLSLNSGDKGCSDKVNKLVLEYNRRLEESIVAVSAELGGAHLIFCDVYRAMMEFINNPEVYGIEDAKNACCGVGEYGGVSGCVSKEMACSEADSHVWWDLYNPTPNVNGLLADSGWADKPISSICRPISIQQLIST